MITLHSISINPLLPVRDKVNDLKTDFLDKRRHIRMFYSYCSHTHLEKQFREKQEGKFCFSAFVEVSLEMHC